MFSLPPLPYDYNALEPFIDEETMRIHHDKHHAAYVDNLNKLVTDESKLEDLLSSTDQKIKNNAGGHSNHSFFWEIMSPQVSSKPIPQIYALKEQLTQAALGRFGSGWAWIVLNQGKLEVIDTPNQDSPIADNKTPILGIDVWEHAYYLKYQNRRAEYIDAWWNVVNWTKVEENFNKAV